MITVLGIDPGLTTGIALISWLGAPQLLSRDDVPDTKSHPAIRVGQVSPLMAVWIVKNLYAAEGLVTIAIESFVESRHSNTREGNATREIVEIVATHCRTHGVMLMQRPAGAVKPWATDVRLRSAGLFAPTEGMRHARDAARHALFSAVRDLGGRDPLSKVGEAQPPE